VAAAHWRPSVPFLTALASLTLLSLAIVAVPALQFAVVAPGLDLVVNTTAALSATAAGGLIWTRWREFGQRRDLLEAAGFSTLAVGGAAVVAIAITGAGDGLGFSLQDPGQAPVYLWTLGRAVAAGLFLMATLPAKASPREGTEGSPDAVSIGRRCRARLWLALPSLIVLAAMPTILALAPSLPVLIGPEGLARLRTDPAVAAGLPGITPLGLALQLVIAALFLLAAVRVDRNGAGVGPGRSIESRYLGIGYVLAAFSQIHMAFYPGVFTGLVTTADVLRIAFSIVVFLGIQEQNRHDLHALRLAADRTTRLREIELAQAAQEERAWLARELHDGLAQDLWLAKLRLGRLREALDAGASGGDLRSDARAASEGLDRALDAARAAVHALRGDAPPTAPTLDELLTRSAQALSERAAVRTELRLSSGGRELPPRLTVELWRIAQEALNNVAKHADATLVRLTTRLDEGPGRAVTLEVADDGRGFDPDAPRRGLGLEIMAERARAIGAELAVDSRPRGGTRISVRVPIRGEEALEPGPATVPAQDDRTGRCSSPLRQPANPTRATLPPRAGKPNE
jgi:signal transduction histidine kinase